MNFKQIKLSILYFFSIRKSEYEMFGLKYTIKKIFSNFTYPLKRFYRFIVKLFKYGKLLWSDFEFDYIYLLKILQLKFVLMADFFETKGMTLTATKRAKELRICANLIQRIIDDNYDAIPLKKLDEKYGKIEWGFEPLKDEEHKDKGCSTLNLYRSGAPKGSPEYEAEYKESRKIYEKADAQKQRDIDYLCDMMKKKMLRWWD